MIYYYSTLQELVTILITFVYFKKKFIELFWKIKLQQSKEILVIFQIGCFHLQLIFQCNLEPMCVWMNICV